jgi:hypothetical protein
MNALHRTIYTLFGHTLLLLLFYAVAILLSALNYLPPTAFTSPIDFVSANSFANVDGFIGEWLVCSANGTPR